jgi:hypothetical protein
VLPMAQIPRYRQRFKAFLLPMELFLRHRQQWRDGLFGREHFFVSLRI